MRSTIILLIIILKPIFLLAQDEKKLSKKEANEEVRRLTSLVESLQSEKEELNNKLMIEYEKLLSEMDENSNLRTVNGELRSEIRSMQEQLLEIQKSFSEKEKELEILNNKIKNSKSKLSSDSIYIQQLKTTNTNQELKIAADSLKIKNLIDSISSLKTNISYLKDSISIIKNKANTNQESFFNHEQDLFNFLLSITQNQKKFTEETKKFEEYLKKEEASSIKNVKENYNCMEHFMRGCGGCGGEYFLLHEPSNTLIIINDYGGDFESDSSTDVLLVSYEKRENGNIFFKENLISEWGEISDGIQFQINQLTSVNNTGEYILTLATNICDGSNSFVKIWKKEDNIIKSVFTLDFWSKDIEMDTYAVFEKAVWSANNKELKVIGDESFTIIQNNGKWKLK